MIFWLASVFVSVTVRPACVQDLSHADCSSEYGAGGSLAKYFLIELSGHRPCECGISFLASQEYNLHSPAQGTLWPFYALQDFNIRHLMLKS